MATVSEVADKIARTGLGVKPGESVLILADTETDQQVLQAMVGAIKKAGAETVLTVIDPPRRPNEPLPAFVAEGLKAVQVFLCMCKMEYTHTKVVRKTQLDYGLRTASMCALTPEDLVAPSMAEVDFHEIHQRAERLQKRIAQGNQMHLTAPNGTDLTFSLEGKKGGGKVTGIAADIGTMAIYPPGDVFLGPRTGSANGVAVFDYYHIFGRLKEPIVFRIKDGWVTSIEGGQEARDLSNELAGIENALYVAEVPGIGLNHKAVPSGRPDLLTEKMMLGTVHIGIGDSSYYGSRIRSQIHIDGMILNPTMVLDGQTIMDHGRLLLEAL